MHCFIVAPAGHGPKVAMLVAQAQQLGFSVDLVSSLDALTSQRGFADSRRPVVLLADIGSDRDLAEEALRFAQDQAGQAYLVYVSDSIDPDIYKRLLRTQTADWSKWELLPFELSEIVKRQPGADAPLASSAKILCFFPSKGGIGNTTLAIETAMLLTTRRGQRAGKIALLDLNLDGGTLADALDIEARFDLHEIAGHPERLDNQLIDVFASRHSDRLDVFATPPRRAAVSDIAPQIIFAVLDLLASRYDVILIDMPNQRLPWNDNLLQGSDGVILTGTSTVPALKQLRSKLAQLDELSIADAKIAVVVNQCEKSLLGQVVRRKDIDRALPDRQLFFIRDDVATARSAANAGRPVTDLSPNSQISNDIRKLVDWIAPVVGVGETAGTDKRS